MLKLHVTFPIINRTVFLQITVYTVHLPLVAQYSTGEGREARRGQGRRQEGSLGEDWCGQTGGNVNKETSQHYT